MKLEKIKDFIIYLYNKIQHKKWASFVGTSIQTYINEIPLLQKYFQNNKTYDKTQVYNKIKDFLNPTKKRINEPSDSAVTQRLSMWKLLNVFEYNNEKFVFKYNSNINYDSFDYFIDQGSKILDGDDDLLSSKRIFIGFSIFLIYKTIGINEYNKLLNMLDSDVRHYLDDKLEITNGQSKMKIERGTYDTYYINHVSNPNFDFLQYYINKILNNNQLKLDNIEENEYIKNMEENILTNNIIKIVDEDSNVLKNEEKSRIKRAIRKWFSNNMLENISDLMINNQEIDDTTLLEKAHIFPVSELLKLIDKYKNKDITFKKLCEIIEKGSNNLNGIYIPFNYHKLFDKQLIKIDWENEKFVFSENITDKQKNMLKNIFGFNENNKFRDKEKFQKIKKNYEEILKLISDF